MKVRDICPVCGSRELHSKGSTRDIEGRTEQIFDLLACGSCQTWLTSPVPDETELGAYYDEAFYGSLGVVGERLMRVFLQERLSRLISHIKPPSVVVDVGCGDGRFVEAMRSAGYDAMGVESSSAGRAATRTRAPVVAETLDALFAQNQIPALVDGCVDGISMWQVLEHVAEPTAFLQSIRARLRAGGVFLVSVPNHASWQSEFSGTSWFHLDVPRHLVHYNPASLRVLLQNTGFSILQETTSSLEYNVFGAVQSALNRVTPKAGQKNAFYKFVKRKAPLSSLRIGSRLGVMASVAALPALAAAGLVAARIEEMAGRGGTLTVLAKKI